MRGLSFWLVLLAGSVLLTLLCWSHVLGYGLTDTDTLMHIREGRVESAGDVFRLLSEKLTGGRARVGANFYRPTVMLAFAGLRGAFGWEPLGYHAFDLTLHAIAGALLAGLGGACARVAGSTRPRTYGVVCGAVFLTHPLAAEVVPAIARNGDLLVTVLQLGALLALHAAAERRAGGLPWASPSVVLRLVAFYALFALTIGAKEPGVVLLGAAFCYVAVVRREGDAFTRLRRASLVLAPCLAVFAGYFALRAHVLGGALGGYGTSLDPWLAVLVVANQMAADLVWPGYAHRIGDVLPPFHDLSPAAGAAFVALVAAAVALAVLLLARAAPRAPAARVALFGLLVALLYAGLFVATGFYERRFLYPVAAFASFPAATALVWSARRLTAVTRERPDARLVLAAAIACLALLHLPQTPLLHRYDEWRESGEATRLLTEAIRSSWSRLPDRSKVLVANMPSGFSLDPLRSVMYLGFSSTNSPPPRALLAWLEEALPGKRIHLNALGYHRYLEPLAEFRHRARVRDGWIAFDSPAAITDFDDVLASRRDLRTKKIRDGRHALAFRGREAPEGAFLLIFDGSAPRFVPLARIAGGPRRSRAQGPGDTQ